MRSNFYKNKPTQFNSKLPLYTKVLYWHLFIRGWQGAIIAFLNADFHKKEPYKLFYRTSRDSYIIKCNHDAQGAIEMTTFLNEILSAIVDTYPGVSSCGPIIRDKDWVFMSENHLALLALDSTRKASLTHDSLDPVRYVKDPTARLYRIIAQSDVNELNIFRMYDFLAQRQVHPEDYLDDLGDAGPSFF